MLVSPLTLMVTVGSIGWRPTWVDGDARQAETLALTLSFDHTVVDGAPAARFATRLRALLEDATVARVAATVNHGRRDTLIGHPAKKDRTLSDIRSGTTASAPSGS